MPGPTPHRTPLRRLSHGSLFALSRSGAFPDAPHGLGFIEPALAELLDETEALHANVEGLRNLSESLSIFNESFSSWLYVLNMNALTTDWPQAPTDASFELARRRNEEDARAALSAALQAQTAPRPFDPPGDRTTATDATETEDVTYSAGTTITTNLSGNSSGKATVAGKKGAKPKLSVKEKKERSIAIEKTISCLPLEFRGSDPNLRNNMETVIEALMSRSAGRGLKLPDLIKPPDLTQARVNKCLIALVNRKIVTKNNTSGTVLYYWQGIPN